MAIDLKYGEIQTERGNIPGDEPVFLIRAQDDTSISVLAYYVLCAIKADSPLSLITGVIMAIKFFREWQQKHPGAVKEPD